MSIYKELKKIMTQFIDDIESAIKNIHTANGVDNATVVKEISDAVSAGVAPLQTQISDLQKALQDTVTALTNGDTVTAQAVATAAVNATPATNSNAPATGAGATGGDTTTGAA